MNPVPNQTVCNNANTTAVNFSGAPAGAEYNWTNDQTSIGLAASGTGNIASFVATNPGTAPVVSTITVTPVTVSNIYYIRNANPWGLTLNDDAMNAVFGASNWTAANYSVNPATVFSAGTRFVFIEGSDNNANAMNAFITANITDHRELGICRRAFVHECCTQRRRKYELGFWRSKLCLPGI